MKILVIVESIDINENSGSKANVALIKNLKKAGFDMKVYHYTRKSIMLPDIECKQIMQHKISMLYLLAKMQLLIQRLTKVNINTFVESILGFSFSFFNDSSSIRKALKEETGSPLDWVLTLSYASSFRSHKALLGLSHWHNKWLAYIHDPYPMHSYPRPYDWVEPGHQYKRAFFLKIVSKSKYLVYPSLFLADWMQSYYPGQLNRSVVIPHQLSDDEVEDTDLPSYFNPEEFNILHAGNMMSARKPIALIEAFENFLKENPLASKHSKLHFVGAPSRYDGFIKDKQQDLPQLFLSEGYMPYKEVLAMQLNTSVNVILETKGFFSPFLPGKFAHCIKAQKPILLLGPYYSESKRLLGESYPFWSAIDDVKKIQQNITALYSEWSLKRKLSMKREDLAYYLSSEYLKKTISELKL